MSEKGAGVHKPEAQSIDRQEIWVCAVLSLLLCLAYSLRAGQDINWDFLNYHSYGVYALLHGRWDLDVAPSQVQTWLNPLGSVFAYGAIALLPPIGAASLFAAVASLTVVMVYLVTAQLFLPLRQRNKRAAIALCACSGIGAISAPIFLSELGGTINDQFVWLFVVSALYLYLKGRDCRRRLLLAGLLLGVAAGLKLTAVIYCIGLAGAILLDRPKSLLKVALPMAAGFLPAVLLLGGGWMLYLYHSFGNPLFPLYNNIFQSPAYLPLDMLDRRFQANALKDVWAIILGNATGRHLTSEMFFIDFRFSLAVFCSLLALPLVVWRKYRPSRQDGDAIEGGDAFFLAVFFLLSFAYWIFSAGIERYALGLEQIAPLFCLCLLASLTERRGALVVTAVGLTCFLLSTTVPANWGRYPFTDSWLDVAVPQELAEPDTLFVMIQGDPTSFVIPFLPPSDRFVRISGNMNIPPQTGLGQKIQSILREHKGPLRSLSSTEPMDTNSLKMLDRHGLTFADGPCLPIPSKAMTVLSCPLTYSQP